MNILQQRLEMTVQRLDGYQRLDRRSKPCGNGWIPINKQCRVQGGRSALAPRGKRTRSKKNGGTALKVRQGISLLGAVGGLGYGVRDTIKRRKAKAGREAYEKEVDSRHQAQMQKASQNHREYMEDAPIRDQDSKAKAREKKAQESEARTEAQKLPDSIRREMKSTTKALVTEGRKKAGREVMARNAETDATIAKAKEGEKKAKAEQKRQERQEKKKVREKAKYERKRLKRKGISRMETTSNVGQPGFRSFSREQTAKQQKQERKEQALRNKQAKEVRKKAAKGGALPKIMRREMANPSSPAAKYGSKVVTGKQSSFKEFSSSRKDSLNDFSIKEAIAKAREKLAARRSPKLCGDGWIPANEECWARGESGR